MFSNLITIRQTIAISIWIPRISVVTIHFLTIRQTIAIAIRISRVSGILILTHVAEPIAVGIAILLGGDGGNLINYGKCASPSRRAPPR